MTSNSSNEYYTMSITSYGPSTLPKEDKKPFFEKKINDVSDIDGAKSQPKYKHYFNKPPFLQSDVDGSTSKPLTKTRNTRDLQLYIDDIEGSRHYIKDRMMQTKRNLNPLEPQYILPSYAPAEYAPPKFIKDSMDISDIDGTKRNSYEDRKTRDNISVTDIVGAQANWRPRHRRVRLEADPHDIMAVEDISAKNNRYTDKTNRHSNPLNPEYSINGMYIGDDSYTKPSKPKPLIADNYLLKTKDIAGAFPNWKTTRIPRRDYRNTNFIGDIIGAQADTIRPGIVTKREVNPLDPVYQALDPGETLDPILKPLIPLNMIKIPTINMKSDAISSFKESMKMTRHFADDLEPVLFSSNNNNSSINTKTYPQFNLDLSKSDILVGTSGINGSGRNSNRNISSGYSPVISGRVSGRGGTQSLNSTQRRAIQDKLDEINLVKQLQDN